MGSESGWEPILDGALADRARSTVLDIARAIERGDGIRRSPADLALFWAYVAGAIDESWTSAAYDAAVDDLLQSIDRGFHHFGLHGGLANVGFVIAHVSEPGAADSVLGIVDESLLEHLAVDHWTRDYDLITGLVGLGVYFLERIENGLDTSDLATARAGLTRVVDHLLATAEETPHGTTWFTAPELLPPNQLPASPNGYYNCGLAHGVPGVAALFGRIAGPALDDATRETLASRLDRARTVGASTLQWLQSVALPPAPAGRFTSSFHRGASPIHRTRTAWCYGDPGVAIASWSAAARLGLPTEPWIEIARESATRPFDLCGTRDSGICHGSAGLAHLCNRFYQASREPLFRDAARTWFTHALDERGHEGVAGYRAWLGHRDEWEANASILEGAAGVALTLLAALPSNEPVEPRWDRYLQTDL